MSVHAASCALLGLLAACGAGAPETSGASASRPAGGTSSSDAPQVEIPAQAAPEAPVVKSNPVPAGVTVIAPRPAMPMHGFSKNYSEQGLPPRPDMAPKNSTPHYVMTPQAAPYAFQMMKAANGDSKYGDTRMMDLRAKALPLK